jgi:hypothetical protein
MPSPIEPSHGSDCSAVVRIVFASPSLAPRVLNIGINHSGGHRAVVFFRLPLWSSQDSGSSWPEPIPGIGSLKEALLMVQSVLEDNVAHCDR